MKLLVAAESQKVVGVHLVGPECAEIIQVRVVCLRCLLSWAQGLCSPAAALHSNACLSRRASNLLMITIFVRCSLFLKENFSSVFQGLQTWNMKMYMPNWPPSCCAGLCRGGQDGLHEAAAGQRGGRAPQQRGGAGHHAQRHAPDPGPRRRAGLIRQPPWQRDKRCGRIGSQCAASRARSGTAPPCPPDQATLCPLASRGGKCWRGLVIMRSMTRRVGDRAWVPRMTRV